MLTNDLNIYVDWQKQLKAPPAPVWGPAGTIIEDPTFRTPIMRLTDASDGSTDKPIGQPGPNFGTQYDAFYDSWNTTSTVFVFTDFDGGFYVVDVDPVKLTIANKRQLLPPNYFPNGVYHSRVDPNIAYVLSGPILYKHNWATGEWLVLTDFRQVYPGATVISSRGFSESNGRLQLQLRDNTGGTLPTSPVFGFIWDYINGKVVRAFTAAECMLNGAPFPKGEMDRSGKWMMFSGDGVIEIDNPDSHAVMPPNAPRPAWPINSGHGDWGSEVFFGLIDAVDANGVGLNEGSHQGWRRFHSNGTPIPDVTTGYVSGPCNWSQSANTSFRDGGERWAAPSQFRMPQISVNKDGYPFCDEIYMLPIDGPADGSINKRICHHHTDEGTFDFGPDGNYWARQQHQNADQSGLLIAFTSPMATNRCDVYLAQLDSQQGNGQAGGSAMDEATVRAFIAQALTNIPKGAKGDKGDPGPMGPRGPQGPQAPSTQSGTAQFNDTEVAALKEWADTFNEADRQKILKMIRALR